MEPTIIGSSGTAEEGAAAAVVLGLLWNSWSISLAPDWLEILLLEVTTGWQLPLESQCCDWLAGRCSLGESYSWIVNLTHLEVL